MAKVRRGEKSDVKQLIGILKEFDTSIWKSALRELGFFLVVRVGFRVRTTWGKIEFEVNCWDRSTLPDGCVKYTSRTAPSASGKCQVSIITPGEKLDLLYSAGVEVLVCGDAVHLPPADEEYRSVSV